MNFFIDCYIPSLKKEIKINKLCFGDFYECALYIENKDYESLNQAFEDICKKATREYDIFSNLDKFSILLQLYTFYINPILKLSAKDYEGNNVTYEIFLKDILKKIKNYNINEFYIPKKLFYSKANEILEESNKTIQEIKNHLKTNKILLFEIPEMIKGIPKIYMNCYDNSLFHFLRIVYSENQKNIIKKIKRLKKEYNFLLDEIYSMTPKEISIFLETK